MPAFGLIGKKLGHSFSRTWFERQFTLLGLNENCSYENVEIKTIDELLNATAHLSGFNVTIPYKGEILPYLDELSTEAIEINAVNCVVRKNGKLIGHNTDSFGFENSLKPLIKSDTPNRALVLGASGGAAQSVKFVLKNMGIKAIGVTRLPHDNMLTYDQLSPEIIAECRLIVNCTPLGMWPDCQGVPNIPFSSITHNHILYDLVYNPAQTTFLKQGRRYGATVKNGLEMLHLQAAKSWELFFEHQPF